MVRATGSPTFLVTPVPRRQPTRIGYAVADRAHPDLAVYAERAIPANRVVPAEGSSAFSDLDFATYVGPSTVTSLLATTDLPLNDLPLTGDTARVAIPFGDSSVTLVTRARGSLGGTLGQALPWVFLAAGLLITLGAALVTHVLVRRRRAAQEDAATIADLYGRLDEQYGQQRSIAEALQQALIPQRNPTVPCLEVATRYQPGTDGLEIGGDWFSLIEIGGDRFAFAVGDVSGKGVAAAAVMARLRFTARAYLLEGHPPDEVLAMCSRQVSVVHDGHLATVLLGVGDTTTGRVTLASAGHLAPLRITAGSTSFVDVPVGLPLGVAPSAYVPTTVDLGSGEVLVAFTDGMVERRGESIDRGLGRLAAAVGADPSPVEDLVDRLIGSLGPGGSDDDVAVLAFRWTGQAPPEVLRR